jgi:hypothetical protein
MSVEGHPETGRGGKRVLVYLLAPVLIAAGFWLRPTPSVEEPAPPPMPAIVENKVADEPLVEPGERIDYAEFLTRLESARQWLEECPDYFCEFHRRQRLKGKLPPLEVMRLKLRHEPFAVYVNYLEPPNMRGQEAIFADRRYDNKIVAHAPGLKRYLGTLFLEVNEERRINETGLLELTRKLARQHEGEPEYLQCAVYRLDTVVDGHEFEEVLILNPAPIGDFHVARLRILFDKERGVPLTLENWHWKRKQPAEMELHEEYHYRGLQTDVGLTDDDFDYRNPAYDYP